MAGKSSPLLSPSHASPHTSTPRTADSYASSSLSDLGLSSPTASGYHPRFANPLCRTDSDREMFSTPRPTKKEVVVILRDSSPTTRRRFLPSFCLCLVLAPLFGILYRKPAIGVPVSVGLAGLGIAFRFGRRSPKTRWPIPRINLPTPSNAAQHSVSSHPSDHPQ
jgi:hypothetical protein